MRNVSDQAAIDRILRAIAQDDALIRHFSFVVGVSTQSFDNWIDTVQLRVFREKRRRISIRYGHHH